jgi:uncharacterized protein DUF4239
VIASYVTVSRAVLNSMPYVVLLCIVTIGAVCAALLTLYLVRRFLDQWRSSADAEVIGGVAAMVLTLFALLLAFGIVTLYDERRAAQGAVAQEAGALAVVQRDVQELRRLGVEPGDTTVREAIRSYVRCVQRKEFPAMRNGQSVDDVVSEPLGKIFASLRGYRPTTVAQTAFYESAVAELNEAVTQRRSRLQRIDTALPFAFAVLLILTSAISVLLTCFIKTTGFSKHGDPHPGIEYVLVGSVAFVVAVGLLTALIFEFPFSGPLAVSDFPYRQLHGPGPTAAMVSCKL